MRDSSAYLTDAGGTRIRKAESRDLPAIVDINRKSFVLPYTVSVFREFFREHRYAFLVAECDGRIAGYAMSRILRKFDLRGLGVKRIGHIMSLAVEPSFRRRGIGRDLLDRTMDALWGNGANELQLEVRVSNQLALEMYRNAGFKDERVIPGYYSDGEDAVLMTKGRPQQ